MTVGHPPRLLPAGIDTEIAIVGGGLSGTLAAILLGRQGYRVTLIDRYPVFPREFRVEKIAGDQIETLRRIGLLDSLSAAAAPFDEIVNIRGGSVLDHTHALHYGIFYDDLVGTMRAELPESVRFIAGRVGALEAGPDRQRISIVGQQDVTARLLVLATGMGDIVLVSGENKTIGTSAHRHNLAALDEPLRSHGGLTEQRVPFIVNRVMKELPDAPVLRNFDAFYYAVTAAAQVG